jgi:hypothetical protein
VNAQKTPKLCAQTQSGSAQRLTILVPVDFSRASFKALRYALLQLNGHIDTIPDVVGRPGSRIDLAIFTEGNHVPALLSGGILDAFRSWAKSHPDYAALPHLSFAGYFFAFTEPPWARNA